MKKVLLFCTFLFALCAAAQNAPLPKGTVADVVPTTCTTGFARDMSCFHATVSCPSTVDIGVTFGYNNPQPQAASVVVFNGGFGTTATGGQFEGTYSAKGIQTISVAWDKAWEDTGEAKNVRYAACRGATLGGYLHDNVHQSGKFAAQGTSAGSALVAYWLSWYGGDSIIDYVELMNGPVLSDILKGCKSPKAADVNAEATDGERWTDHVWFDTVRPWVSSWTGYQCVPNGASSAAANSSWMSQSILASGALLSYRTPIAQWSCTNGLNNSSAQGFLYASAVTSDIRIYGVDGCNGSEGIMAGTVEGQPASTMITNDLSGALLD